MHRTDKCTFPKAAELVGKTNHRGGGTSKHMQEVLDTVQDMLMGQVQAPLEPGSAKAGEQVDRVCTSEIH